MTLHLTFCEHADIRLDRQADHLLCRTRVWRGDRALGEIISGSVTSHSVLPYDPQRPLARFTSERAAIEWLMRG